MFNLSSIATDKLTEGAWIDFAGGRFKIASINNFAFARAYAAAQRPFQRQIDKGTLDPAVSQELLCRAMSKHILLDWENVGDNGSAVPYSPETAFNALMNNPELRSFVQEVAIDIGNFRAEEDEDEVKS
jgi:hypothetical protein